MRVDRSGPLAQRRVGRRSESLHGFRRATSTARIRSWRCRASTAPRSRSSAQTTLKRNGTLPWRAAEECSATCAAPSRNSSAEAPYTTSNVTCSRPSLRTTSRTPISRFTRPTTTTVSRRATPAFTARFERDLIERYESRLKLDAGAGQADAAIARDVAFDALLAVYRLVDPMLKADTGGARPGDTYDDAYFEKFFTKVQPMLEQQLSAAITATAGMIVGAWDQAGRPAVTAQRRAAAAKSPSATMTVYLCPLGARSLRALFGASREAWRRRRDRRRALPPLGARRATCGGTTLVESARHAHAPRAHRRMARRASSAGWPKRLPSSERCGRSRSADRRHRCCFRHRSANTTRARRSIARWRRRAAITAAWIIVDAPLFVASGLLCLVPGTERRGVLSRLPRRRPLAVVARRASCG